MSKGRKYIFEDLNSFVNGRLAEMCDEEVQFRNQVQGVIEMLNYVILTRLKLQEVYNRLTHLKMAQENLDRTIDTIQMGQDHWADILHGLDNHCQCACVIFADDSRAAIYQLADNIFTTLKNSCELLENVDSKVINYNQTRKEESVYVLFQVLNRIVGILEKLHLHVQKLQNLVNFNEHLKNEILGYYFCNRMLF